jgi:hypothetical protein
MPDPADLNETARHWVFLTAAWIANVDGNEDGAELDALCQLRKALDIAPTVARRLHDLARSAAPFATPTVEVAK